MNLKVFILISIFSINFHSSLGQQETVRCLYQNSAEHGYTCVLDLNNPNGFDGFVTIEGTHLAGKTDEDVRRIEGSGQTTTNIPRILCDKFINTEEISITRSSIVNIGENSFRGCRKLKYINLERNQISKIDENSFFENAELNYIELWSNQLTALPENLFIHQHKLAYLAMDNNQLADIPNKVFKPLTNLKTINLSNNRIPALNPEWFETLVNLENLYLHSNQIEELPKRIFSHMSKLTEFVIYSNRLRVIHSHSFGYHHNLHFAWLQLNQIEAIDEKFILNTSVSEIGMNFNVCAHGTILDESYLRVNMRMELRKCFENYEKLTTGSLTRLLVDRILPPKMIAQN